jgi:hypothetical protein
LGFLGVRIRGRFRESDVAHRKTLVARPDFSESPPQNRVTIPEARGFGFGI